MKKQMDAMEAASDKMYASMATMVSSLINSIEKLNILYTKMINEIEIETNLANDPGKTDEITLDRDGMTKLIETMREKANKKQRGQEAPQ
jgi:hypothetical protein